MISEFRRVRLGSRQAPDPVDHFLENHFLYRKHTVTDATSLFRVVSEQVYDTQVLHYEVRMECVRFMFRKRRIFEAHVPGDFDDYLWRMEKTHTEGTMLELSAMCLLYRRNMVVYESFQLGKSLTMGPKHNDQDVIRVFRDRSGHFDTVFTLPEIEMAAVCQAIAYKLLYKQVFRLPDISLAVEAMLYPETFSLETQFEIDAERNVIRLLCPNGRTYKLDRPETTRCLLANYKTCAYHNRWCGLNASKSPLPISCVRQLLADGGHPFPYTVSKSLDPYTYRNVELFCLNAARREARNLNIYMGDYNFKVGAKCRVALEPNQPRKLTICHVQSINWERTSSVVFSEDKAKFLKVPYSALHPMPFSEFQPWVPPYRQHRRFQFRRPKTNRMRQPLLQAPNTPMPFFNRYESQHSEGRQVTLPFPLAPGPQGQYGNDQMRYPPLPPPSNQGNHSIANRPPMPTVPQPLFYPMPPPPPGMGPPQVMPGQYPLQPQMIRPPMRFYFMPPLPPPQGAPGTPPGMMPGTPQGMMPGTPPGMMPLPFAANNAPMIGNTFNDFKRLSK